MFFVRRSLLQGMQNCKFFGTRTTFKTALVVSEFPLKMVLRGRVKTASKQLNKIWIIRREANAQTDQINEQDIY